MIFKFNFYSIVEPPTTLWAFLGCSSLVKISHPVSKIVLWDLLMVKVLILVVIVHFRLILSQFRLCWIFLSSPVLCQQSWACHFCSKLILWLIGKSVVCIWNVVHVWWLCKCRYFLEIVLVILIHASWCLLCPVTVLPTNFPSSLHVISHVLSKHVVLWVKFSMLIAISLSTVRLALSSPEGKSVLQLKAVQLTNHASM